MVTKFDLLGDPIPENFGRRGRPAHIPTLQNRNRVMLLQAMGWDDAKIAQAIGITGPTLKKHYFRELRFRDEARPRAEAKALEAVYQKAIEGNVTAAREWRRLLERTDVLKADESYRPAARSAPQRLGKKEERQAAAEQVGGIYVPGAPPRQATSH